MNKRFISLALSMLVFSLHLFAQIDNSQTIPDAQLTIAARDQQDGKLGKSIYIFTFTSDKSHSTLTTLRIRCEKYSTTSQASSFRPEIWCSSTVEGTLKVRNTGTQFEVSEILNDFVGETKSTYIFSYSGNRSTQPITKLTSFSGGSIMTSSYTKEVHAIKFLPFTGNDVFVPLDCNTIWLPGVDTTK